MKTMSEQEIIEGNKLIAVFMGAEVIPNQGTMKVTHYVWKPNIVRLAEWLTYHSDWNWLMPVVEKIEQITLKEVIGVAASKPYWENEKLTVSIGSTVSPKEFAAKQANDFPVCFTINGKKAWIQYYFTSIHGGDGHFEMREANTTSKIESAWKVVVDFIKFYNSNKS